jgi:hypothetical protein
LLLLLLLRASLFVSGRKLLDKLNVLLLSILLRKAFKLLPSVPLGLTLKVKNTRSRGSVVTNSSLLEKCVKLFFSC